MFTGIIETTGIVVQQRRGEAGQRLRVDTDMALQDFRSGASVCVSGVCLTIVAGAGGSLEFDVIAETLQRSTLGAKKVGDRVNLERSLRMEDRLDGHFVQGHVDGIAVVDRVISAARESVLWLKPEPSLAAYLIPKGSVAVDGVSLTIAQTREGLFSVALIPTTLARTTLSSLRTGDRVNIESDIIVRTIVHRLSAMTSVGSLSMRTLDEAGFV